MKKNEKIFISTLIILIIILLAIIGILLATNIKNKNIIQKQVSEVQKLAETSGENSFITTADHLAEVNTSLQTGIEQGKLENIDDIKNYILTPDFAYSEKIGDYVSCNDRKVSRSSNEPGGFIRKGGSNAGYAFISPYSTCTFNTSYLNDISYKGQISVDGVSMHLWVMYSQYGSSATVKAYTSYGSVILSTATDGSSITNNNTIKWIKVFFGQ